MMTIATILSFIWLLEGGELMGAVQNGMMIVGIGAIGWAIIKKVQEGDIWSAVSTGVLGGLAIAFISSPDFRKFLVDTISSLMRDEFGSSIMYLPFV